MGGGRAGWGGEEDDEDAVFDADIADEDVAVVVAEAEGEGFAFGDGADGGFDLRHEGGGVVNAELVGDGFIGDGGEGGGEGFDLFFDDGFGDGEVADGGGVDVDDAHRGAIDSEGGFDDEGDAQHAAGGIVAGDSGGAGGDGDFAGAEADERGADDGGLFVFGGGVGSG